MSYLLKVFHFLLLLFSLINEQIELDVTLLKEVETFP